MYTELIEVRQIMFLGIKKELYEILFDFTTNNYLHVYIVYAHNNVYQIFVRESVNKSVK